MLLWIGLVLGRSTGSQVMERCFSMAMPIAKLMND